VEIDPAGAGDHLDEIDMKIHRLKELMRSVVAGLPYTLGKDLVKDLVFTGYKPDFKTELSLAFGDYVEVYDPKSKGKSNDIMTAQTEPCVALYPSASRNGSWVFYSLLTKGRV